MHVLKDEKTSWFKWEWFEAVTPESVFLHISSSQLWPNCFGPLVDLWCRKTCAFAIWQVVFMIFEGIKWNLCHHLLRLFQTYGTTHLLYSLKHKRRFFWKMSPCSFSIQLDPIDFHCMVKNSFNILQNIVVVVVFCCTGETVMQVWNNMCVNKWWQTFLFMVIYPLQTQKQTN